MITLKLLHKGECYWPNSKYPDGGIDMNQILLFEHIAPNGIVNELDSDFFFTLVKAHGWEVEITNVEE